MDIGRPSPVTDCEIADCICVGNLTVLGSVGEDGSLARVETPSCACGVVLRCSCFGQRAAAFFRLKVGSLSFSASTGTRASMSRCANFMSRGSLMLVAPTTLPSAR